ncbi:MAG: hypothetical protein AAGI48_14570 [Verrucomicrobiota bacterium]
MRRRFLFPALTLFGIGPSFGQVRIHDPVISVLAKPYGIERRIEIESIDALYCAEDGEKRLVFTLRSSGVKEVQLKQPDFSLDIVLPDGSWASLGTLSGCGICFPITGDKQTTSRTYVAKLKSELRRKDLEAYLKQTAAAGSRVRMLGEAELVVGNEKDAEFSKKGLSLEVSGRLCLADNFKALTRSCSSLLPKPGQR